MTGFDAYTLYLGLKLHFSPGKYDFIKYCGKVNTSPESFDLRKDKYFFHKLARKFPDSDQLKFFLAANFFARKKSAWIGDLLTEEAQEIYLDKLKIKESLEYIVTEDLEQAFAGAIDTNRFKFSLQVKDGQYPILLHSAIQENIHWETLVVLNACVGFFPVWSEKITDTILWPAYRHKCERYQPFLGINVKKFQAFLRNTLDKNTK
jgi:hypothetical protein